jgi:hypothetical protein
MPKISYLEGKPYLTFFDKQARCLYLHQLDANHQVISTDTVSLKLPVKRLYQGILDYQLISRDSILVALNPAMTRFYSHDSAIFLITWKKEIRGIADLNAADVITWSKIPPYTITQRTLIPEHPLYLYNTAGSEVLWHPKQNGVIVPLVCFNNICKSCGDFKGKYSLGLAFFDGRPFQPIPEIQYPCPDSSVYYSLDMRRPRYEYNRSSGELVCGFGNSPHLFVISKDLKVSEKKVTSHILDTIYPLKAFYDAFFDYSRGAFMDITYSPRTNGYYRLIRVGNNRFTDYRNNPPQTYPGRGEVHVYQYLDSALNLVGEGYTPYEGTPLVPHGNNVLFFNESESLREQKIIFDVCDVKYRHETSEAYISEIASHINKARLSPEQAYKQYLATLSQNGNGSYLVFNAGRSCRSCIESMVGLIRDNIVKVDPEKKFKVVVITSNRTELLTRLNLTVPPPQLIIDDKGTFKEFLGDMQHADWVENKDGTIEVTKYEPQSMHELEALFKSKLIK